MTWFGWVVDPSQFYLYRLVTRFGDLWQDAPRGTNLGATEGSQDAPKKGPKRSPEPGAKNAPKKRKYGFKGRFFTAEATLEPRIAERV